MISKILIYEVHYSNFNRYVIPLSKYFVENEVSEKVVMVYDSFVEKEKIKKNLNKKITNRNISKVYKELKKKDNNSDIIFINYSYRIPDLYWTYKLKKIGVRCYQQQHGMYAEFLERSFLGYFSAINRKITYFKYLFYFLLKLKASVFLYLINKDFVKSENVNNLISEKFKKKIELIQSDHIFVWGDYWKKWFMKNHFYKSVDQFTTIGNPDYHVFIKNRVQNVEKDKVCYIAQTFVEDGRMDRVDYKKIIDKISETFKEQLLIKLHPRSDKTIFESVINNGGELLYDFPITGYYIGHYSSLLALAINEDANVFLLEINNEKIPHYFLNSANKVFYNIEELCHTIIRKDRLESSQEISYFFENKETHPFEIITNFLINII